VFVNHTERVTYELGHPSTVSGSFRVEAPVLDYFLIAGPTPGDILGRYTALTGRAALPPLWSFGIWMSRCMYRDRAEVEEAVTGMRGRDIPLDVIHVDPRWLKSRRTREADACDFEWDEEAFGDPKAFIDWLRERGVRLSLWENPYLWSDCEVYAEAKAQGYLVPGPDGEPAVSMDQGETATVIDYTNPAAVEWVKEKHRRWLHMGVACFKTDYGEAAPAEGRYANGLTGEQVHNLFPLLYNRAVFEVTEEVHGKGNALVFSRSGTAGSQRYPLAWAGDSQSTWGGMAGALRCGLSQALSGVAFWTADAGGFHTPPGFGRTTDPVIYTRWAQWVLLCSHARFHGLGPREPWHFGDDAVRIVREFARLRYRLLPYLWSLAHEAAETGIPVMRPLVLEYPHDPVAPCVETQYLLGPSLLVCPVFNAEGRCTVYLPPGRWHDWWDGAIHEGPRHLERNVPLDRMPLFVRDGSVLPLAPAMAHTGAAPWDPIELQVRGEATADLVLWTPDQRVPVRAARRNNRLNVRLENAAQRWLLRLIGLEAVDVTLTGAATDMTWAVENGDTLATFAMRGQGSAQVSATLA
jgi:alpha-D-xyloside xylohydrolase